MRTWTLMSRFWRLVSLLLPRLRLLLSQRQQRKESWCHRVEWACHLTDICQTRMVSGHRDLSLRYVLASLGIHVLYLLHHSFVFKAPSKRAFMFPNWPDYNVSSQNERNRVVGSVHHWVVHFPWLTLSARCEQQGYRKWTYMFFRDTKSCILFCLILSI